MTSLATRLPVAQWLKPTTVIRKVVSSIPIGDPDFLFVRCPWQTEYSIVPMKDSVSPNTEKSVEKRGVAEFVF